MLRVRRSVFERALWETTSSEPGVTRLTGHVDAVEVEEGRVVGVVVDSASGRRPTSWSTRAVAPAG